MYVLGETKNELGGSEYFALIGEEKGEKYIGNNVPGVDAKKAVALYKAFSGAIDERLVASAQSVTFGGLGVALAKTAIAGQLGMEINLPTDLDRNDYILFSESQSRIVATIAPENKKRFEELVPEAINIGKVTKERFVIKGLGGKEVVNASVSSLTESYKKTLRGY